MMEIQRQTEQTIAVCCIANMMHLSSCRQIYFGVRKMGRVFLELIDISRITPGRNI